MERTGIMSTINSRGDSNILGSQLPDLTRFGDLTDYLLGKMQEYRGRLKQNGLPHIAESLREFTAFFAAYNDYFRSPARLQTYFDAGHFYQHTLSRALDKTREAWKTLSWAVSQRDLYGDDLRTTDKHAGLLYERFLLRGDVAEDTPITYFDKEYHITRSPFQTRPLIATPLGQFLDSRARAKDASGDDEASPHISAMAHELGHHVFWNSGNLQDYQNRWAQIQSAVREAISGFTAGRTDIDGRTVNDAQNIWLRWVEEAFADIFGTLLVGPAYVVNAQNYQVLVELKTPNDLLKDDGEHPMPFLRPQIALATLEVMADKLSDDLLQSRLRTTLAALRERWQPYQERAAGLEAADFNHGHLVPKEEWPVSPFVLEQMIAPIVRAILEEPIFASKAYTTLLDATEFWGKTQADAALARDRLTRLVYRPLPAPFDLIAAPTPAFAEGNRVSQSIATSGDANQFTEFLGYIRGLRDKVQDKANSNVSRVNSAKQSVAINQEQELQIEDGVDAKAEWEDVLEFELLFEDGHKAGTPVNVCTSSHGHGSIQPPTRHKHPTGTWAQVC
jgi:hypothetical protein